MLQGQRAVCQEVGHLIDTWEKAEEGGGGQQKSSVYLRRDNGISNKYL